jgi:hypothetical protein
MIAALFIIYLLWIIGIRIGSELEDCRVRVLLAEEVSDEAGHWRRSTVQVHCIGVIQRAYFFENIVSDVSFEALQTFRRVVKNVVQFNPVALCLKLLPQHDVLFSFIGKQKDKFNFLVRHVGYFHHRLINRRDSTASSYHENPLAFVFLVPLMNTKVLMMAVPPAL